MKVSELKAQLDQILEAHGDMDIVVWDNWDDIWDVPDFSTAVTADWKVCKLFSESRYYED